MRRKTKLLIARQIGISEGFVWREGSADLAQAKKRAQLLTLAENILATVERGMSRPTWQTESKERV